MCTTAFTCFIVVCCCVGNVFATNCVHAATAAKAVTIDDAICKAQQLCSVRTNNDKETLLTLLKKIKATGDVNIREHEDRGTSALEVAVEVGDLEIVTILLALGVDLKAQRYDRVLHLAVSSLRKKISPEMVRLLVKHGADVNANPYNTFETPLHYAADLSAVASVECIKILLENGANINVKTIKSPFYNNDEGRSPFLESAHLCRLKNAEMLLDNGADIQARDAKGKNALMIACKFHDVADAAEMVKFLLEKGLNTDNAEQSDLMRAVAANDAEKVRSVLAKGRSIEALEWNGERKRGFTPLMLAAGLGRTEVVRLLLANRADVNIKNNRGMTALMAAALNGHAEIVRLLLAEKADAAITDDDRRSVLTIAIQAGSLDCVKALLADEVIKTSEKARKALDEAALHGRTEIVRYLLDQGLDVNKRSDDGTTVLLNALGLNLHKKYGICNLETVNLLLDRGADRHAVDKRGWTALMSAACNQPELARALIDAETDLHAQSIRGMSLIECAAGGGNIDLVRFLLARGVSPKDKRRNEAWTSPLFCAVRNGNAEIARLLLDKGANVNPPSKDSLCALLAAVEKGYVTLVELLLSRGAHINVCDKDGNSPLHAAVGKGYVTLAELLLSRGAHINVCDKDGNSPLHKAVDGEETGVVELLLSRNADIRIKNAKGDTAWMIAVRKDLDLPVKMMVALAPKGAGSQAVVNQILFLRAAKKGRTATLERKLSEVGDINCRDQYGCTALHYAAKNNHTNSVNFLLSHGAEVDARNSDRMTPLMLASRWANTETVALLLSKGADVHAKDNREMTALARCVLGLRWGNKNDRGSRVVDLLLAQGADIESKDAYGRTALLLAIQESNDSGVELLLAKGAQVNTQDSFGVTPLTLAAHKNEFTILKILLSKSADISTASIARAFDVAPREFLTEAREVLFQELKKRPEFSGNQKSN